MLVLAVQRGDGDAFAELFRRHYPAVRKACARRLFDAHEADEVAQAAFVRAYERIDQCAGERRFGPWVHVIARSLCVDTFRAQARVEPREQPLAGRDHRPNEPEESLLHRERVAQMQEALDSLPDRQRRAVIARDWDELRPGEIADHLGLSVGAVDSLLLRARRRLAHSYLRLAGEGGGGASTLPVRSATAAAAVTLSLGPQALMAGTAAAAQAVHATAGRAAGGVVAAVVSVALSLGGGAPTPEPAPDPPAVEASVVTVPPAPVAPLRPPMPGDPSVSRAGVTGRAPVAPVAPPSPADAPPDAGAAPAETSATPPTTPTTATTAPNRRASATAPPTSVAAPPTTTSTVPAAASESPSPPPVGAPEIAVPGLVEVEPKPLVAPEEPAAPAPGPAPEPSAPPLPAVPTAPATTRPERPPG